MTRPAARVHFWCLVSCCSLLQAAAHGWTVADLWQLRGSLSHPHFVDEVGRNVLMRIGNAAVYSLRNGPHISEAALDAKLHKAAGNFFPKGPYELVDVCMLHGDDEARLIGLEQQAFGRRFFHWPVYGVHKDNFSEACGRLGVSCPSTMQPQHMKDTDRSKLANDHWRWDPAEFENRVVALRTLLEEAGSKSKVVFFHGLEGSDRTGALFAAYVLRYRNRSLTEAIAENELIAGRHMSYEQQLAAQWYCEYLVSRGLYSRGYDCGNCEPFRCSDKDEDLSALCVVIYTLLFVAALTSCMMVGPYRSRLCGATPLAWMRLSKPKPHKSFEVVVEDSDPYATPPVRFVPLYTPPPAPNGDSYCLLTVENTATS